MPRTAALSSVRHPSMAIWYRNLKKKIKKSCRCVFGAGMHNIEEDHGMSSNSNEHVFYAGVFTLGMSTNSNEREAHEPTISILNGIMEALVDANNNMIGVCRSNDDLRIANVLEKMTRRIQRDNLFDVVVKAAVTKVPDLESIQEEISSKLNLKFDRETVAERASLLCDRIKKEQRILIILCDLWKGLDLGQVGIPFGVDHTGCKILLTSASENILSDEMKAQKVFFLP